MNTANPKVDYYFEKDNPWKEGINRLRQIILDTNLVEELKWGCPCYTYNGKNIVLIHIFKEYFAVLFFKGALINDIAGLLTQQSENVQATRQMRFTTLSEIETHVAALRDYIFEAVNIEEKGLKVPMKKTEDFAQSEEFKQALAEDAKLKAAFHKLTPGRQRAYWLYFSSAKQAKTRMARIEKVRPQILLGKGMND